MSQEPLQHYLRHPSPAHLEQVVREYHQLVWQAAFRVTRHAEDAADICQDVFLKLLLKPPPPHTVLNPRVYLCWQVLGRQSQLRMAAKRRLAREAQCAARQGETGLSADDLDLLQDAISRLPESLRVAIECSYLLGLGSREIAEMLGITDQAVRQRLEKGRQLLRRRLAPLGATLALAVPSLEGAAPPPPPPSLLDQLLHITEAGEALAAPAAAIAGPSTLLQAGTIAMSAKKLAVGSLALLLLLGTGATLFLADPWEWRAGKPPLRGSDRIAAARVAPVESLPSGPGGDAVTRADLVVSPEAVEVDAGVSLVGTIRDGSGQGVPGARLLAIPIEAWSGILGAVEREAPPFQSDHSGALPRLREAYLRLAEELAKTSSDQRGIYRFKDLSPGEYRLLAEHADFLPSDDNVVRVEEGTPARCDIELQPGLAIAGKVVDLSGQPLPGVEVLAELWSTASSAGVDRVRDILEAWDRGRILFDQGKAMTAPDGTFRLRSLEPAYHHLIARRKGFLEGRLWSVRADASEVTLTLTRGARLVGRILDPASAPVAQAKLRLSPVRSAEVHRLFDRTQEDLDLLGAKTHEAASSADGRFEVEGIGAGTYELLVHAAELPPLRREATVREALLDLGDLLFEKPLSIAGVVRAADGEPLARARVWIDQPFRRASPYSYVLEPDRAAPLAEARTGADGRFLLERLPAGAFDIQATAEGVSTEVIRQVRAGARDVDIVVGKGFALQGTVVDQDSAQPVAGVDLRIGLRGELRGVSDAHGRFEISSVPHSALTESTALQAYHPDYGVYLETRVSLFGRDERSPLCIRLPRSGILRGSVVDARGEPVSRATVFVEIDGVDARGLGPEPSSGRRPLTAEDGSFFLPVPSVLRYPNPASLYVIASHPDRGTGRFGPVEKPGSRESWPEMKVVLEPDATVRGVVTDVEGKPVAGARVQIRRRLEARPRAEGHPELAGWGRGVSSRADGSFSIRGVEIGRSEIRASAVGHASWQGELEAAHDTALVRIVLPRGGKLAGRVVDSQGNPVGGAEVAALPAPEQATPEISDFARRMRLLGNPGVARVRTGTDGRYRLEDLPQGPFTLVARAEGHEPATSSPVRSGEEPEDLVLARFSAILGTVRTAGSRDPVTDFSVEVLDRAKLKAGGRRSNQYQAASEGRLNFHDPDGRFVYDGMRPGDYTLLVHAPGLLYRLVDISLGPGEEETVEVLLDRAGRIDGIVLDAESGEPVPGAMVHCRNLTDRDSIQPPGSGSTRAGEDGTFTLSGLVNGTYGVRTEHPLYRPKKGPVVQVVDGQEAPTVELKLAPAGRIEGRVKGHANDTMSCRVILKKLEPEGSPPRDEATHLTFVEPEGYYRIDGVQAGTYRVELKKQAINLGRVEHFGPTGASQAMEPAGPEVVTVLGEVVVSPRQTAVFDFAVP